MNMFRTLRADEIDCRIAQVKKDGSGLSLLLYKDARCDQNILDEVVGPYNWKREHTRDNKNCIVSIWDEKKQQWIGKEDTGTESNTEQEKGLASDSFKRACFNWGIGRELYTAPFIWIKSGDYTVAKDGKVYDRFTVHGIGYTDGVITGLEIKNQKLNRIVYRYGKITEEAPEKPEKPDAEPQEENPMQGAGQAEKGQNRGEKQGSKAKVDVETTNRVPQAPEKQEEPQEVSPVKAFLFAEMKAMREARKISPAKNNKLFTDQWNALIAAGFSPKKKLDEYTMPEAESLIKMMYEKFDAEGTEIKA
jgi:hypothetical protein